MPGERPVYQSHVRQRRPTLGTTKRQWGFNHILTKKYKARAEADVGLMFVSYNLRRIFNILGKDMLQEYLIRVFSGILGLIIPLGAKISNFKTLGNMGKYIHPNNRPPAYGLAVYQTLTINSGF